MAVPGAEWRLNAMGAWKEARRRCEGAPLGGAENQTHEGVSAETADVARVLAGGHLTRLQQGNEWSEWQDLNLRPPRPERGALPD